jgi:hypothetical protein
VEEGEAVVGLREGVRGVTDMEEVDEEEEQEKEERRRKKRRWIQMRNRRKGGRSVGG